MIALMPNCGFLSETSRMLHIAQALQAQGDAVCLATHGGPYLPILQAAGLPVTLLEPQLSDARQHRFVQDLVQIGKPGVRMQPPEEVRQSIQAEAAFLKQHRARAVVTGFTLTAYLSARVAGIPLVASHGGSFVPPVLERGLAPAPQTMPIPGTEWLPRWAKQLLANQMPQRMTGPTRFLNEAAAELSLEPVPTLAAMMMGDLTLVTDLPEVLGIPAAALQAWQPARPRAYRAAPRLVYTGPLYAKLDLPVPPAVQAFMDGSQPTALVVLSSAEPTLLRAAVRRVRAAGVRVIVGATIHEFGPADDAETVVAGILPNHLVMPQVNVAITMGGQGSVQCAMASGTPVVGIPLHPEQELNVNLAARHHAGMAIPPRHVDSTRLTQAVQRVLGDPRFAAGARQTQAWYRAVDGAANAAIAIRRFLDDRLAPTWRAAA